MLREEEVSLHGSDVSTPFHSSRVSLGQDSSVEGDGLSQSSLTRGLEEVHGQLARRIYFIDGVWDLKLTQVSITRLNHESCVDSFLKVEIIGKDGRAAILREVAKGLQMPVDDIIPSREKAAVTDRLQSKIAAQQQSEQQGPVPRQPDGSPQGGMDANLVNNRAAGGEG